MTRLPDGARRPAQLRLAQGEDSDLVLELTDRYVAMRPKRVKNPRASITIAWSTLYRWAITDREESERATRVRVKRKR